jgi:hypothetical protein
MTSFIEEIVMPKSKLILIGECHDKSEGTSLLDHIIANNENLNIFFEIDKASNIHRLFDVWESAPDVKKNRSLVLNKLIRSNKAHCYDLDPTQKWYENDSMREKTICDSLKKLSTDSVLLIGFAHIYAIHERLKNDFDILLFLPKSKNLIAFKKTLRLSVQELGFFYDSDNLLFGIERAKVFLQIPDLTLEHSDLCDTQIAGKKP